MTTSDKADKKFHCPFRLLDLVLARFLLCPLNGVCYNKKTNMFTQHTRLALTGKPTSPLRKH